MQQSNIYIVIYAAALTVICGVALALTAEGLKPKIEGNIDLERKANILMSSMEVPKGANIAEMFTKRVKGYVITADGSTVEGDPASIDVSKEYKKPASERKLPVYEILTESGSVDSYVVPVYGFGLWDNIWGFVAIEKDGNTIKGVKFDHKGETPGLGARIATDEIQARYKGKQIFEGETLRSVFMLKGEGNTTIDPKYEVDGLSGATLTGKGVTNMLTDYFGCYKKFLLTIKAN